MARSGLGSAWSLKVAAVWTNLPVSHVTPSVSPGMWEEAAHPRSCHTISALPFSFFFFLSPSFFPLSPLSLLLKQAFVLWPPAKVWPPNLSVQSVWLQYDEYYYFFFIFFFFPNPTFFCAFLACCKKISCLWLHVYATFNFPLPLGRALTGKHGTKGSSSLPCCSMILKNIFQHQLMPKTQPPLLDNELNLTWNATNNSVSAFPPQAVNKIFKQAETHMFRIC